ncbi:MAG: DUF2283 domain-containing protein [Candidatus Omnitrophota bacterium]|jgi:uncharacterized protein YuzE|nr:MAG: DUF2283 domain-containing protein [Candidatus Omnitrophota bacterium]
MKIKYDNEADPLYVTLAEDTGKKGIVKRNKRVPNTPVTIDYNSESKLFGIEIFDLSACTETGVTDNFQLQYIGSEKTLEKVE